MLPRRLRELLAPRALAAARRLSDETVLTLDFPPSADPRPRWGHGRPPHPALAARIAAGDDDYRAALERVLAHAESLERVPPTPSPGEPGWRIDYLRPLDTASLYAFIRDRAPRRYVEIGSGESTAWARRAISDGDLSTELVSIDPAPRTAIDAICDRVIRSPLEVADTSVLAGLAPGDIIFMDGSHRAFPSSDATVFFLDLLPALAPGVLVGVHDVFLPDDYIAEFSDRLYSEQYLLAAWLLGGASAAIELPCWYVSRHADLAGVLTPLWDRVGIAADRRVGFTFWLTT
jgi:predicted O-methyltransferase YrrM